LLPGTQPRAIREKCCKRAGSVVGPDAERPADPRASRADRARDLRGMRADPARA
jgi:hypothetical protein